MDVTESRGPAIKDAKQVDFVDGVEDIVEAARRGDVDSLGALFDMYYDRVYRFAYVRLGSVADAEEAAAETFSRMVRSIRRFTWRGSTFAAWLLRIARNVVADEHRRRSRRPEDLRGEIDDTATAPGAEETLLAAVESERLAMTLAALPAEQRRVLELRFASRLSAEEIGQVLGKSAGAVRIQQMRAIETLRRAMEVSTW